MHQIKTHTEADTRKVGSRLANYLKPGNVITLEGDLGSGKTTFTKGIAEGLGVKQMVTSPTFTIVKEYKGTLPFYHMDAYRLEYSDEDIGFLEYFNGDGISVVEWAEFIEEFLPQERLHIKMNYLGEQSRRITFYPYGLYFKTQIEAFIG